MVNKAEAWIGPVVGTSFSFPRIWFYRQSDFGPRQSQSASTNLGLLRCERWIFRQFCRIYLLCPLGAKVVKLDGAARWKGFLSQIVVIFTSTELHASTRWQSLSPTTNPIQKFPMDLLVCVDRTSWMSILLAVALTKTSPNYTVVPSLLRNQSFQLHAL